MKNKFYFVGLTLGLFLIHFCSCQKKLCDAGIEGKQTNKNHEVRDSLIDNRIVYFAGVRKLNNHNVPDPGQPLRRVIYRNVIQLPMNESGIVKLYVEIDAKVQVTYLETLPKTTNTKGNTLKKIIKAAFGYKYEANYNLPAQASIFTINLDITKQF